MNFLKMKFFGDFNPIFLKNVMKNFRFSFGFSAQKTTQNSTLLFQATEKRLKSVGLCYQSYLKIPLKKYHDGIRKLRGTS